MKPRAIIGLAAALAMVLTACGPRENVGAVTVVGWGGSSQTAHRLAYWNSFAETTGIPVVEDVWHGGVGVLRAKVMTGRSDWDVIQVEAEEVVIGCEEGLLEPIDWGQLGGRDAFVEPSVHDCGVGAMVWSQLFGYDGDRLSPGPANWADFWDVERFPGKRGMRKTPKYTLEFALMADGVRPDDVYSVLRTPQGVTRAFAKLDELRPHILWWSSISQVADLLASGEVSMSVTSPGRLLVANREEGRNFRVVWIGNVYSVDYWAILKGTPDYSNSMALIQHMKLPANERRLVEYIPTGLSSKQAIESVSAAKKSDTPSNPENLEQAVELDTAFWVERADDLNQRFNAWAAQ